MIPVFSLSCVLKTITIVCPQSYTKHCVGFSDTWFVLYIEDYLKLIAYVGGGEIIRRNQVFVMCVLLYTSDP